VVVLQILVIAGRAISFSVGKLRIGRGGDQLAIDSTRKNLAMFLRVVLWIAGILFLLDN
jgi:hypothetical protein